MLHFNAAEQDVFIWMVGNAPNGAAIMGQFVTAVFKSRTFEAAGFRTEFEVARDPNTRLAPNAAVGAVWGVAPGLKHGIMFVLRTGADGYLEAMEGNALGEPIADLDFDALGMQLHHTPIEPAGGEPDA